MINTPVAATVRLPIRGAIVVDPTITDIDADTGTLDQILPPTRGGLEITGSWDTPALDATTATYLFAGALKGGGTNVVAGAGFRWSWIPSSTTPDAFEFFTDEWYDDVTTDTIRAYGGVITDLTITYPDDMGPLTASASTRYSGVDVGSPTSPTAPTAGLVVDPTANILYGADTDFKINSTAGAIGTTKLTDTFHGGSIHITTELDLKRFANGSNTRFQIRDYGRVTRSITAEFRFSKQAAIVTEVANLLGTVPLKRFVELRTLGPSPAIADLIIRLAGYWTARTDDVIGGNDIIVLTMTNRYDLTLGYPITVTLISGISTL